jgi:aryl-alcohol dehydrogenase-like predicted oxidoreductase
MIQFQLPYNLLWRSIEYDIVPKCKAHNIGVLAYSPLQQGMLTGKYMSLEDVPEGRRRTRLFNCKRFVVEMLLQNDFYLLLQHFAFKAWLRWC